jgi:tRNA-splicing ligase RtcB
MDTPMMKIIEFCLAEIKKMDDLGVVHGIRTKNDLDEAAGAYKNIDEVMESQKDLVEIIK